MTKTINIADNKKTQNKCYFKHEKQRVKLCMNRLTQGKCESQECKFQHYKKIDETDEDLIPNCKFFMQGSRCVNRECQFRHVSINPNAPLCKDFLFDKCKDHKNCPYKHSFCCPEYAHSKRFVLSLYFYVFIWVFGVFWVSGVREVRVVRLIINRTCRLVLD